MKAMLMLVLGVGICGISQGAILHGIPGGDATILPDGINCTVNDAYNMPAGYWSSDHGWTSAGVARAAGTGADRDIEIGAGWLNDSASVWYSDYGTTPTDSAWKISSDLKWAGGQNNTLSFNLYADEAGSTLSFALSFLGSTINWTAGTASGSVTSATGLDADWQTASIEYNPTTGLAQGMLGSEQIFQTTTQTGLFVKRVQFRNYMPSGSYDTSILSVDNITAQVPEPVTLGLLLTGGVMLLKRRSF